MKNDSTQRMLRISRERFAPDAIDAAYQGVTSSLHFERTDQTMDVYLLNSMCFVTNQRGKWLRGADYLDSLHAERIIIRK